MERAGSRDGLTVARLVFVGLMSAEVAVLAVTGLWLALYYRPSPTSAWTSIQALRSGVTSSDAMRGVHRLTAFAALPTSIVTAVLVVADSRVRRPGWRQGRAALAAGPALVALVVAATFTGYLLPWDQLALWAVSVGTDMHGYGSVFGPHTRFVLMGGVEVGNATLWRWFVIHVAVLSAQLVAALVVAWLPRRREAAGPSLVDDGSTDSARPPAGNAAHAA